jgi:hypothetical protein
MQLEWARQVHRHTGRPVLIVAPLAVAQQTVAEGAKFGIGAKYLRDGSGDLADLTVCNYEMLEHFNPGQFSGVVLDESSILKSYDGKTSMALIESFAETPYKLSCSATPAPNDFMELGTQAEFLGAMTRAEMLAMFFTHDGGDTSKWRLKGHAESDFWRWVCSWAMVVRKPSDIGHQNEGFELPALNMHSVTVAAGKVEGGETLFAMEARTLQERRAARSGSLAARVDACADLINADTEQWVVWCNLNAEGDALEAAIPGAVQVAGADSRERKEQVALDFASGKIRVLVSKPSIFGYGLNWQSCARVAFVGLSDSYEQFYQAIRRCWRFGQPRSVECYVVTGEAEGAVVANIKRKETEAKKMGEAMVEHMQNEMKLALAEGGMVRDVADHNRDVAKGERFDLHLGDCVEVVRGLADDSVGFSVFSPPFASLYTYSNSPRDMGNVTDHDQFYAHFQFLIPELLRVTKPGRLLSFHCMNLPTSLTRDGVIGINDFRGNLIRAFTDAGWIFHSEVCIWKDPVTAMQRTKALGLLYKQIKKDSCMSRQGIPDYVVTMRKPGVNAERVGHKPDDFPVDLWQRWASPVWMDINPTRTLQYRAAREDEDERHICPLQLDVIERCLGLWSNPGDLVLSPFAGIGSEGWCALKSGRRFVGAELKRSYWELAAKNLREAEAPDPQFTLFK